MTKKFRIEIEFETDEKIGTSEEELDELLDGCWLYDSDFSGAITKLIIKEV